MTTLTLELKDTNTLNAIKQFIKLLPVSIVQNKNDNNNNNIDNLPMTKAKKPNVKALAGIWKDKSISLDDLRNDAWAGRQ